MRTKAIISLLLFLLWTILPAQNYFQQYTHDTLGNRTSRVRGVLTREMETEGISSDTVLHPIAPPADTVVAINTGNVTDESDSARHGALIKTRAEKEAYLQEMIARTAALEPIKIKDEPLRSINDYDVGAIPLQYGVSPTGARTYSIPIATAPDIKYAPTLAFVYNSQGGYGYGGYGWDLAGFSAITLTGKSLYYDDTIKAANYADKTAAFMLDGVRLVQNEDTATSSSYPLVTARGHILVNPVKNASGYVRYFNVLFPNGVCATYGSATLSYPYQRLSYPIVESVNLNGERIEYHYVFDSTDGSYYPDSIQYGFDSSNNACAVIQIQLINEIPVNHYYAGMPVWRKMPITKILSKKDNQTLWKYDIDYSEADSVRLISRVSLTNAEGRELPPLEFSYVSPHQHQGPDSLFVKDSLVMSAWYAEHIHKKIYRRGKFVEARYNDGLLIFPDSLTYDYSIFHGYYSPYPSDMHFLFAAILSGETAVNYDITAESGFQTIEVVDTDGDGLDEIVKVNFGSATSSGTNYTIQVYKSDSDGVPVRVRNFNLLVAGSVERISGYYPSQRAYYWGDFTGDGKCELLMQEYTHNCFGKEQSNYTTLIDLDSGQILAQSNDTFFQISIENAWRLFCIDIDGDGKTEVCKAVQNALASFKFDGIGFELVKAFYNLNETLLTPDNTYYSDINADGYTDIVKSPVSGSFWTVYFNTGASFSSLSMHICDKTVGDKYFFIDINRDGYPDLVRIRNGALGYSINQEGMRFSTSCEDAHSRVSNPEGIIPGNVVDDTFMSSFVKVDGRYIKEYEFTSSVPDSRLLVQSKDSYGKVIRNEYGYLPQSSLNWTDNPTGISAEDGYQLRVLPVYVLTNARGFMSDDSNAPVFMQDTYTWYDGVASTRGLGFCGFSKTFSTSVLDGYYYRSINRFDPQRMGVPTTSDKKIGSPVSQSYYTVAYTWDSHSTTYGKLSPRLKKTVETDNNTGVVTTTTYSTYDAFDYPGTVYSTRRIGTSGSYVSETADITYSHSNSPSCYVLGSVADRSVTRGNLGERTAYTYDSCFRPLTRTDYKIKMTGPPAHPVPSYYQTGRQRWTYDSHGNVVTEESSPYGATQYTGSSYTYDSSGHHLTSSTNALGQTTTYSNFDRYGNARTVTDYRGRVRSDSFDSWGNRTKTVYADGTIDSTATAWGGQGVYTATHTITGKPSTIVHYDALSRQTRSSNQRFNGQWQFTDTEYNQRGLVKRTSLPFRGASPSYWNTCGYDSYGRRTRITEASGRATSWYFSGTSVTETKDSISVKRTTNAAGELVSVLDAAGTITYTLRDDGQPSSVTAPGGATTTFEYDDYGRRTSIVDPSAGTRSTAYTINADGSSVTTETNALGSVATSVDKYGRVTGITRTGTGAFNTTYTYDTYGRLSVVSSTNSTGEEYTYDAYDRVSTFKETVPDGKWLQKSYTYGSGSNVASIAYTSQSGYITTENYSYSNGRNTSITLSDGTNVLTLTAENNLGQPSSASSGSVSRIYSYTAYGFPAMRKLTAGGYTRQDLRTTFNPATGNLTSRYNAVYGIPYLAEAFTYDALGRLKTDYSGSITYDIKGNMTNMAGVGTMTYTNTDPYQIQRLNASTTSVTRPNNQTVTYTAYDRPATITESYPTAAFTYNADYQRVKMQTSVTGNVAQKKYYIGDRYEREETSNSTTERLFVGGDAYSAPMVLQRTGGTGSWTAYVIGRDYLGSITNILTTTGASVAEYSYDPWGRMRDPQTLTPYASSSQPSLLLGRGFCGHEHLPGYGLINMNARLYDPVLGRFLSPDPYVQSPDFSQNFNRYAYALNNPLKYTDESGELLTWNLSLQGFSIGFNFSPIGVPLGFGINIGWVGDFTVGGYAELGLRVGGTGLGSGITLSGGYDYSFARESWSSSVSAGLYASYGPLSVSASLSYSKMPGISWNVGAGLGFGNDAAGASIGVNYGSDGWSVGIGGYYNSHAWDSNPVYEPELWNESEDILLNNNCYSYALDDPYNEIGGLPQPGQYSGKKYEVLAAESIISAAVRDGRVKELSFWNKLGFGKRGYYSVCLVLDTDGRVQDYHWYRQDKGGYWSQKHGNQSVTNIDGRNNLIASPSLSNHNYGKVTINLRGLSVTDQLHYNSKPYYLWVRK